MTHIINLNKKSVNLESIWINVDCPNCTSSMNIQLKKPSFQKNCQRCGKCTFHITVSSMKGSVISVNIMAQVGFQYPVEVYPNFHEIDEE